MEQNWYDKIEAYVEGDLSASERRAMETAMREDPALAKDVKVWQLEQEALLQLRLKKVREEFAVKSKYLFEEKPLRVVWYRKIWVRWAAAVVIGLGVWWLWPSATTPPTQHNTNTQHSDTIPVAVNPIVQDTATLPKTNYGPDRQPKHSLLANLRTLPGQTYMGSGSGQDTFPLNAAQRMFTENRSPDSVYLLLRRCEQIWKVKAPEDSLDVLTFMVLNVLNLDQLGRQEAAAQFLQAYISDPKPRSGSELIWRDLPRLLQMLLQNPMDKNAVSSKISAIRDQQNGSQYANALFPFLDKLEFWLDKR